MFRGIVSEAYDESPVDEADASAETEMVREDESSGAGSCSSPVGAEAGISAGSDVVASTEAELSVVSFTLFSDRSGDKPAISSDSETVSAVSWVVIA